MNENNCYNHLFAAISRTLYDDFFATDVLNKYKKSYEKYFEFFGAELKKIFSANKPPKAKMKSISNSALGKAIDTTWTKLNHCEHDEYKRKGLHKAIEQSIGNMSQDDADFISKYCIDPQEAAHFIILKYSVNFYSQRFELAKSFCIFINRYSKEASATSENMEGLHEFSLMESSDGPDKVGPLRIRWEQLNNIITEDTFIKQLNFDFYEGWNKFRYYANSSLPVVINQYLINSLKNLSDTDPNYEDALEALTTSVQTKDEPKTPLLYYRDNKRFFTEKRLADLLHIARGIIFSELVAQDPSRLNLISPKQQKQIAANYTSTIHQFSGMLFVTPAPLKQIFDQILGVSAHQNAAKPTFGQNIKIAHDEHSEKLLKQTGKLFRAGFFLQKNRTITTSADQNYYVVGSTINVTNQGANRSALFTLSGNSATLSEKTLLEQGVIQAAFPKLERIKIFVEFGTAKEYAKTLQETDNIGVVVETPPIFSVTLQSDIKEKQLYSQIVDGKDVGYFFLVDRSSIVSRNTFLLTDNQEREQHSYPPDRKEVENRKNLKI